MSDPTDPVELETLNLEFGCRVLAAIARPRAAFDRLVDVLEEGPLPGDEINTRLSTEQAWKTALTAAHSRPLHGRLLCRQSLQGRQMLRKILAERIELETVGSGRQRGYKFRGALSLERLIEGVAVNDTPGDGGPNGIRSKATACALTT